MNEEELAIHQWFIANGYRVTLEIGSVNVSEDPYRPDNRPDHSNKFALIARATRGAESQAVRKIKMDENDTVLDSMKRVKNLLEQEINSSRELVKTALEAHVIPKLETCICPVCKNIDWRVSESIFELRGFFGRVDDGQITPVVLATCHICGHILPFNAIHVGAIKVAGEIKP